MTENQEKKRSHFLEPETRCDYHIDAKMKAVWRVQLDIAEEFMRICKAHNLKYFAIGGTLLGAVRHGGYIPWDDDFDFAMMRDQYDLFCKYAEKELKDPYFLQNFKTDRKFLEGFSKIRNSKTTQITAWAKARRMRFNQGICIDIFPLDGVGDEAMLQWQWKWDQRFRALHGIVSRPIRRNPYGMFKDIVIHIFYFFFGKLLCQLRENIFKRQKIEDSSLVGSLTFNMSKVNERYDKAWFEKLTPVPYEYLELPIPSGYDGVLRQEYGDWRKPVKGMSAHSELFFDVNKSYVEYLKEWGFI